MTRKLATIEIDNFVTIRLLGRNNSAQGWQSELPDIALGAFLPVPVRARESLTIGCKIPGPLLAGEVKATSNDMSDLLRLLPRKALHRFVSRNSCVRSWFSRESHRHAAAHHRGSFRVTPGSGRMQVRPGRHYAARRHVSNGVAASGFVDRWPARRARCMAGAGSRPFPAEADPR